MSVEIGYLTFAAPPAPQAPAARPVAATDGNAFARRLHDTVELTGIPDAPPPKVAEAVDKAAQRAADLAAANYELHFEVDGDSGRVIVQVRDLEGNVVRTIPPSEALDVMSGAPLF